MMKAKDIMTTSVATVTPETPVHEIAALLLERRISGVPVVDNGALVGIVTEGDLLRRHEIGTERGRGNGAWWLRLISGEETPKEYVKSHAGRAKDIMTRNVVSVDEGTPIAKIATIFETRRIKRVPVLRDGRLVGIISRANLIQALAVRTQTTISPDTANDDSIRQRLLAELEHRPWWRSYTATVIVTDGVVHYWGLFDSDEEKQAARVAAESVPGVRRVEDHRMRRTDIPL